MYTSNVSLMCVKKASLIVSSVNTTVKSGFMSNWGL